MADLNRQFLERVVVWPGPQGAGWINLHCNSKNRDPSKNGGKDFVVGWPFKTPDDLISRASWLETTDQFQNVWYCTSQQSEIGTSKKGKSKAVRLHKNARWLKAIWVDCDVKPGSPNHYDTLQDAWNVISVFRKKVGLPFPSALVNSGGGLHAYWISTTPLSPEDWRPYAEGLKQLLLAEGIKCDTGLTTDDVRLLRVPGTLNHKYTPPRQVALLHLGADYDFAADLAFLTQVAPAPVAIATSSDFVGSPSSAFASLSPNDGALAAGIERGNALLDPKPIFRECGFLRHALATGGKDYDNPLWNLSVLCTAFMENGNVFAHEISKGHAAYTEADTQALFDRKISDRVDRDVGYPSCATIAGAGSKSCATCPLFSKGKSPLNLRAPQVTAAVKAPQTQPARALQLPDGYDLNNDGVICKIVEKTTRDGDVQETWHPLFYSRIDMPWVQKHPDMIHFRASYDKGNAIQTSVRYEDWCGQGYEKKLAAAQVKYVPENKGMLEGFFMAWLSKMHDAAVAQTAQAFGWYYEGGVRRGFAYGGFIHKDDGSCPQAGMTDRHTQKRFQPTGQSAPWYHALSYITRQKRPELEAVVAASFAAPLMEMTGTTGALLSAWGTSGVGKTYALEVGAAVWGHPKESKEVTSTTWKSVEKRLASTVNLPVLWDEITNSDAQKNVLEVLMLTTGGVRGGRLNSNTDQREKGTWSTLLSINSNLCFKEYVAARQATHTAGLNRVLEYQIMPVANPVGMAARKSEAAQALTELHHNYGNVGLDYARMLGQNHELIKKRVDAVLGDLELKLNPTEEDRFWIGTIAALLVGAELANQLNVGLDGAQLEAFLLQVFNDNKAGRVEANVAPTAQVYAEDALTAFLQDHLMSTIWCERSPKYSGGPGQIPFRRLFPNAPLPNGVSVRFDAQSKQIVMSTRKFRDWCEQKKLSAVAVEQSLTKNYGLTRDRASLAAGTGLGGGQERVLVIDVTGHTDLIELMSAQVSNADLGASVGMSGAAVDTGIVTPDGESANAAATASV